MSSVLNHCCEMLDFIHSSDLENIHTKVCRQILGIKKIYTLKYITVYDEFGKFSYRMYVIKLECRIIGLRYLKIRTLSCKMLDFIHSSDLENIHTKVCRQILGIKKIYTLKYITVYDEFGKFSIVCMS